jgi:hypothetical protein
MGISGHCEIQAKQVIFSPMRASEESELAAGCEQCKYGDSFRGKHDGHSENGGEKYRRRVKIRCASAP